MVIPDASISTDRYQVRFASTPDELDRVQKLRFEIFNLELNEGQESSYATGRDRDEYDQWMHHLYILERDSHRVVGTYRLQCLRQAKMNKGFYTDDEFELTSYAPAIPRSGVEIGRACVHSDYRSSHVLRLLWKGIAMYLDYFDKRYLFGCTSLPTTSKLKASCATEMLQKKNHFHDQILIPVRDPYRFELPCYDDEEVKVDIPRLLLVYLRYGAKVCSLPALDCNFQTIDFLTIFDLENLPNGARRRFFN